MSGTGLQPSRNGLPTSSGDDSASNQRFSENFKTTQRNVKTAITRASTTGLKTAEQALQFMDDTSGVYDALGLKTIDNLRKKLIVIAGMIETDTHFFEFVKNAKELLSDKERQRLREVAKAHLDLKPRTDNLPIIKNAISALQEALEKQSYHYAEEISPTETADISEDVANSPVEEEEPFVEVHSNAEILQPTDDDIKDHDRNQHPSTVGFNNSGGTQVPPVVISHTRSSVEDHEASSGPSVRALTASASHGQPMTCPVCDEGHELFRCKSSDLPRYLARNGLCVLCMSNRHETHMCPLQNAGSSPYFAGSFVKKHPENGGRFMTQNTKIVASKPRERIQSNFPSLSDREGKEHIESARTPAPRTRMADSSDEDADDECRAAEKSKEMKTNVKWLSYYDLDAILPKFSGDPLRYKKFMTMFESLGMNNPRLDDMMRLILLENKLVGDAKGFYCELRCPRKSIEVILEELRQAFEKDDSEVTEVLKRFSQLSFHETDHKRAARQLMESKSLIRRLREFGEDVNTPSFVRSFIVKLPAEMLCKIRPLFDNGSQPSLDDIIDRYDHFLRDHAFADRFRAAKVSERLEEIPEESVMATSLISSKPTKSSGNFAPGKGGKEVDSGPSSVYSPTVALPATAPLGVIETLKYSPSGEILAATVRFKGKIYEQPVYLLIPLEVFPSEDDPALELVEHSVDPRAPPDPRCIATFPIHSKSHNNKSKIGVIGQKSQKVLVQGVSEVLDKAGSKIPDVGVGRSGTPTEGIGLKSNGAEPLIAPLRPLVSDSQTLGDCMGSGADPPSVKGPDLDVSRSGTSKFGSSTAVPSPDVCRSGTSGEGEVRESPELDTGRSGASKGRIGLKSSGSEYFPDSGSPRKANYLAFDGTPRSGSAQPVEPATDLDASRSGAPRKRIGLKSSGPEYFSATPVDTVSDVDVGRSGTSKRRRVSPTPVSDACRSGTSEEGYTREVPALAASRSGASKARRVPPAPDSDASRSGASGEGAKRRVPNLDVSRNTSVNDSVKFYSNPAAPRQRKFKNMDDRAKSSGSAISHGEIVPQDTVNQSPGVSYPMVSSRPDGVDQAKARVAPSHRVRPYNPRKPKAKLACYACITQSSRASDPRSVDSLLVPESGSCPTPN